jgi:hypothetical protein
MTIWEKLQGLLMATITHLINILITIFIGVFSITQLRLTQTKLFADCVTAEPYTDDPLVPEQVHLDFISNKSSSGDMRSIKAYYPVNYNQNLINNSYLFKVIKILTKDVHSNVIGNYIGTIFSGMAENYTTVYTSIAGLFNSILPEIALFFLGFIVILIAHLISAIYSTIKGIISFYTHVNLLFFEKELIEVNGEQQASWQKGEHGMWDTSWNIFYSVLIYIILIIAFTIIFPLCSTFALFMKLSILFTPFFLLRLYSSTKDIDAAIQKNADKFTFGINNTSKPDKNMSGGADDDKEDTDTDNDDDDDKDKEEGNASDDEGDVVNGQPHPNMPKRFTLLSHTKKFIKVYRNFILILISLYLIMDMNTFLGPYAMGVTIFAIVVLWYFTELYQAYKIKDTDKFTTYLLGTAQAEKKCRPPKVKDEKQESKKWYFLWLM